MAAGKAQRPRWLRWLRGTFIGLGISVAVLVALVAGLLFALGRPAVQDRVVPIALDQLSGILPGLKIDRLRGPILGELIVEGLTLKDRFGGEAIAAQRLELRYDLWALARGVIRVEKLNIVGPRIFLGNAKNGKLNMAELVTPGEDKEEEPSSDPITLRLELGGLSLSKGSVTVDKSMGAPLSVAGLEVDLGARFMLKGGEMTIGVKSLALQIREVVLPDGQKAKLSLSGAAHWSGERVFAGLKLGVDGLSPRRAVNLRVRAAGTLARPQVELDLLLPRGGRAQVKAQAVLDDWLLGNYDAEVVLEKINPAAIWPGLPEAMADLRAEVHGDGVPLQEGATLQAVVESDGARFMEYKLDRLRVQAAMEGERWSVGKLEALAHEARVDITGNGDLGAVYASKVLLSLPTLSKLPLPKGMPALGGGLNLDLAANGPFTGPLSARVKLAARNLQVDKLKLGSLRLAAHASDLPNNPQGTLSLSLGDLDPGVSEGQLRTATINLDGGMDGLDLKLDAAGPRVNAGVGAHLTLKGERLTVSLGRLALRLDQRKLNLTERTGARLDLKRDLELGPARFKLLGGTVELQGKVKQRGFPRLQASVKAAGIKPLPDKPAVGAEVDVTVGRKSLDAVVKLDVGAAGVVRASLPVRYGKGPAPGVDMGGTMSVSLDIPRLPAAVVRKWVPGLPPFEGVASLSFKGSGSLKSPTGALKLGIKGGQFRGLKGLAAAMDLDLGREQSTVALDVKHLGKDLLRMDLKAGTGPGKIMANASRLLSYLEAMPLSGTVLLAPTSLERVGEVVPGMKDRLQGTASARVELAGVGLNTRAQVSFKTRALLMDRGPLPDLDADLDLVADGQHLRTKIAVAARGRKMLTLDGGADMDLDRLLRGRVKIPEIPISARLKILPTSLARLGKGHPTLGKLRGKLEASANVSGTVGAPEARVDISVKAAALSKAKLGDLGLTASLNKAGMLAARVNLDQLGGGKLRGAVALNINKKDRIGARLTGKDLDLGFLTGLTNTVRASGGKLNLDFTVDGPLQGTPEVLGKLDMRNGHLLLSGMSPLANIEVGLLLKKEKLELSRLAWRSGGGKIEGKGEVALASLVPGNFDLGFTVRDYDLGVDPVKGSTLTTDISIGGGLANNKLTAAVELKESMLKLSKIGGKDLHKAGDLPEVVFVDVERPADHDEKDAAEKKPPMALEVSVSVDSLFVRGEDLDVTAMAHVKTHTNDRGQIGLLGEARLNRGWIKVLDNKFTVKRAIVQFGGEPKPDPALDVRLTRDFTDVVVYLTVGGTASKPDLKMSSDPAVYTQAQILSMIITGKPQIMQEDDQDSDPTSAVTAAVLSTVLGPITRKVANSVGLDVAKVSLEEQKDKSQQTGDEEVSLKAQAEVGKYITDRIYLGYRKVFGATEEENSHEAILEYAITAQWLIIAMFGDKGIGGVDIFWTYRY